MIKNPVFTLVLGLMVGLALGYVLAENQPVPPAKAMAAAPAGQQVPERRPQMDETAPGPAIQQVNRQAAELQGLLARNPNDAGLMTALGNLYFDASRWEESRNWYEQAIEQGGGNADVLTDLAVVYRNLKQPDRALTILDSVVATDPEHWQAVYNRIVVLHFDLHRHDDAVAALQTLEGLAANNAQIPDLSSLASQVRGG